MPCRHCIRLAPRHRLGCPLGRVHVAPICGDCGFGSGAHHSHCPHAHDRFPLVALPPLKGGPR